MHEAGEQLSDMRNILGTMNFYRFDYWQEFTGLDMVHLHDKLRIDRVFAGAQAFLAALVRAEKNTIVVTNADRQSLQVKEPVLQLSHKWT